MRCLQILQNDLEFLFIGSAMAPTGLNNLEQLNLSTALIALHKDCYTALGLTPQGGRHRKEAKNKKRRELIAISALSAMQFRSPPPAKGLEPKVRSGWT